MALYGCQLKQSLVRHTFFPALQGYVVNASPFIGPVEWVMSCNIYWLHELWTHRLLLLFFVDLYKVMIRNSEYDVVVAWNLCLSRNDPKLWMLCGCMKSMPVSLHFGLKLGVSLLMLKPISHFPWFWNRCLLISSMSLLFSGFLSTQLLFILCLMS
jgi:hypothetical protein